MKRVTLFDRYAKNLRLVIEGSPKGSYNVPDQPVVACPLCFRLWDESGLDQSISNPLTVDHIPPEALGGKPIVLTCKECNNQSGSKLDSLLKDYYKKEPFLRMEENSTIDVRIKKGKLNAHAKLTFKIKDQKPFYDFQIKLRKNQDDYRQKLFRELFTQKGEHKIDWNFHAPNDRHVKIAWLRIAYLLAFSKFGYGFIINHRLDLIREQILNPNNEILPSLGTVNHDKLPFNSQQGFYIFKTPKELRCLYVAFNIKINTKVKTAGVCLPSPFTKDIDFYTRFSEQEKHNLIIHSTTRKFNESVNYLHEPRNVFGLNHEFYLLDTQQD